jgi:hypothetical protein
VDGWGTWSRKDFERFVLTELVAILWHGREESNLLSAFEQGSRIVKTWSTRRQAFFDHFIGLFAGYTVDYALLCQHIEQMSWGPALNHVAYAVLANDSNFTVVPPDQVRRASICSLVDEWLKYLFVRKACDWLAGKEALSCPLGAILGKWITREAMNKVCRSVCENVNGVCHACELCLKTTLVVSEARSLGCLFWRTVARFFDGFAEVEAASRQRREDGNVSSPF